MRLEGMDEEDMVDIHILVVAGGKADTLEVDMEGSQVEVGADESQ